MELTTNLIIAASEADEHLTTAEIDRILGVRPAGLLTPRPDVPAVRRCDFADALRYIP